MTERKESTIKQPAPCPGCAGSGQTSYFGGESRFMLTWEDCPDCCGTGILLDEKDFTEPEDTNDDYQE
jgi:DnaJ-class molecular chaperone